MKRFAYIISGCLLGAQLIAVPAHAEFSSMEEKKAQRDAAHERIIQESKDITAIRESQQQAAVLLKGLIVESRKQTVLLNSQAAEQANLMAEVQKQTKLLEELVAEIKKMNGKKKEKDSD